MLKIKYAVCLLICFAALSVKSYAVCTLTANCGGTNVLCNGASTGTLSVTASGGTSPYTYSWSSGATTASVIHQLAGTYTVTVTDNGSCTATCSFTITQPTAINLTCGGTNITCGGNGHDGTASVTASGGIPPYTYLWNNGATVSAISGLAQATYIVTVKDANNCTSTCSNVVVTCNHVTMYLQNCSQYDQATIQFDLMIVSDGPSPSDLRLASVQYGVNFNTGVLKSGATFTPTYVNGTTDANLLPAGYLFQFQSQVVPGEIRINTKAYTGVNTGFTMAIGTPYRVGTFKIASSATLVGNSSPNFNLQSTTGANLTNTAALVFVDTASIQTTFDITTSTPNSNSYPAQGPRSVSVACSLTLNPCDLTATATSTLACFGSSTGTATAIPNSPNDYEPWTYLWSPGGQSNQTATNLSAGTYLVTVTDDALCTATANVTVTQPATAVTATCGGTGVSCGGNNGTASVTAGGGVPGYKYHWNTGSTNSSLSSLSAATYTVTVKDANNCTAVCSFAVTQTSVLSASCSSTNLTCTGGSNGTATIAVTGGGTPYTYIWSNGGTTSTITSLTQGSYSVTVTDACTNTKTCTSTVNNPPTLVVSCGGTSLACAGGNTGSASVTASGGTLPYSYLWSNGATTSSQSSLSGPTTYTVTVTDFCGKTNTCSYFVTSPSAVAASCANTNVSCNGGNSGTASVTASGGTPGYTYLWSNGKTSSSIATLTAGAYTVTVTDNCATPGTATCSITVTQPTALSANCSSSNNTCNGASTGSATVTATGGTSPYTYLWSNGITTSTNTSLSAGTYTVTVTDSHLCTATCSQTINQPSAIIITLGSNSPLCSGYAGTNINLSSSVTGGTPSYTYSWSGPNSFSSTNPNPTINGPAIPAMNGTYTFTVTDANSCISKTTTTVTVDTCNHITMSLQNCQQISPTVIQFDLKAVSDGSPGSDLRANSFQYGVNFNINILQAGATVTPTYVPNSSYFNGILNGFTFPSSTFPDHIRIVESAYTGGNTNLTMAVGTQYLVGTFQMVSSLPYKANSSPAFTLQDTGVAGKTTTTSIVWIGNSTSTTVFDIDGPGDANTDPGTDHQRTLSPPTCSLVLNPCSGLTVTTSSTSLNCNGVNTGTATASSSTSNPPLSYLWSNGAITSTATGLAAGTYTVTVTDANGCSGSSSTVLTQPTAISVSASQGTAIACNGGTTTVTVSASGGSPGYSGTGTFTESTGSYTFIVTDSHNCTATATITITQPTLLNASCGGTNVSCNSGSNGTASVTASGGTAPYSYSWSSGQTSTSLSGLSLGTYAVTVTDSHSCTATCSFAVTQPTALTASSSSGNIACNGGSTTVTVTASGGTSPYSGTGNFTKTAGSYTFIITDAKGCTASTPITINQPSALTASSSLSGSITCNGGSATVTVTASGGTSPYSGTGNFTKTAGSYTFIVTDANSCTATTSVTITQPNAITVSTSSGTIACNGASTTVNVSATGGASPYSGTGSFTETAGSYTFIVTDANGCTAASATVTINQPTALTASSSSGSIACNGGSTTITVTATGGTSPYSGTGTFTNKTAGTYSFIVTDSKGCTATTSISISQPAAITAASSSGAAIACNGGTTTVTVSASGGTPPYSGTGNFAKTAGNYTLIVTDASGCTGSTTISITQPTAITVSSSSGSVSCGGTTTVNVSATGGTPPYTGTGSFTEGAGTYTFTVTDANSCTASSITTVSQPSTISASSSAGTISCNGGISTVTVTASGGLPPYSGTGSFTETAGSYTFVVTDNGGCTSATIVNITQPSAITVSSVSGNISCNGGSATVTVTASGGTPPYSGTGNFTKTAGSYTFIITDNKGCTSSTSITINQPTALTASSFAGSIACNGGSTTVNVAASGGTAPYSGTGSFTKNAGSYSFIVTDANGCTASTSVTITQPLALIASASNSSPVCSGNNVNLSSTESGGAGGNIYLWSGPNSYSSTNANDVVSAATTANSGTYTLLVTDGNGCFTTATTTVTVNALPAVTASSNSPVTQGGTLNLSSTGGFTTYSWSGPNSFSSTAQNPSIPTVTVNGSGTYTVTVTNVNGCSASATTTVVINSGTTSILALKVILSGFYRTSGPYANKMIPTIYNLGITNDPTDVDTVVVNLWAANHLDIDTFPNPDYTAKGVLHQTGQDTVIFPLAVSGNSYYIAVLHRNHIETWSTNTVAFSSAESYDFTVNGSALNNTINPPLDNISGALYGLWGGDVNQDGTVDIHDMVIIDNQSSLFLFGYNSSDCDGDLQTGAGDMSVVDNNSQLFISTDSPRHY